MPVWLPRETAWARANEGYRTFDCGLGATAKIQAIGRSPRVVSTGAPAVRCSSNARTASLR
jgi:hypothetical protein